jgi:hypothetical protein
MRTASTTSFRRRYSASTERDDRHLINFANRKICPSLTSNHGSLDIQYPQTAATVESCLQCKWVEGHLSSMMLKSWNSTYRMIKDALEAKAQIKKWTEDQNQFPPLSPDDWSQLQQVKTILSKFDEFTQLVSRWQFQISLAIPIYYELHDILEDAASGREFFHGSVKTSCECAPEWEAP